MSCDGCAGAGTTRSGKVCEQCRSTRPRQIKLNQLAARYVVALLEQLGAKPAPVTDFAPRCRRMLIETFRDRSPASAGDFFTEQPWILADYPAASCSSATSTRPTTPLVAGSSAMSESAKG